MGQGIQHNPYAQTQSTPAKVFATKCFDGQTSLESELGLFCGTLIEGQRGDYLDQVEGHFSLTLKDASQKVDSIINLKILWSPNHSLSASRMELLRDKAAIYANVATQAHELHQIFNRAVLTATLQDGVVMRVAPAERRQKMQAFSEELGTKIAKILQQNLKGSLPVYPDIQSSLEIDYPVDANDPVDVGAAVKFACAQGPHAFSVQESEEAGRVAQLAAEHFRSTGPGGIWSEGEAYFGYTTF